MHKLLYLWIALSLMACVTPEGTEPLGAASGIEDEELYQVNQRPDIAEQIGQVACNLKVDETFNKKIPIEDAQIYVEKVKPSKINPGRGLINVLDDYGRQLAQQRGDLGYGRFDCGDQTGVVFVTRAPWPFELARQNFKERMSEHCRDIQIGFAEDGLSYPYLGKIFPRGMNQKKGHLSVECFPKNDLNLGPQLWYLVNFHSQVDVPFLSQSNTSLVSWMNSVRRRFGMQPYKKYPLNDSPETRAIMKLGLNHKYDSLKNLSSILEKAGYKVLSEAKVVGENPFSMATLLWESAPHRAFILDRRGSHIAHLKNGDLNIFIKIEKLP